MDSDNSLSFIDSYLEQSEAVKRSLKTQRTQILDIVTELYGVAKKGGRIYTFGNGGSACDAMHLAEELVARYLRERPGIRAQHLIDSGTMTCWANDYSFDTIFQRQVETLATKDDAVVGFTTSGNSKNVIAAMEAANKLGAVTIALTGKTGGKAKSSAKHVLVVCSDKTSHIQEAHVAIVHIVCDLLEQWLFPDCR
ncbi:MAG TPA: SIS domain-containing protein [Oligoflexia bacterium]|nr:SIS domain-containing protein [Oligoflexia bacterium]